MLVATQEIQANVTKAGTYSITTDQVNGITFANSGTLASTGTQSITLTGTGTPTLAGTETYTLNTAPACSFTRKAINNCSLPIRSKVMFCGGSYTLSDFANTDNSFTVVNNSCTPDSDTQALLITLGATIAGNGAAWLNYLQNGGRIITEHGLSDDVYNEIYGTSYPSGTRYGDCRDNVMPSLILNPTNSFWTTLPRNGYTATDSVNEGCGNYINAIVDGDSSIIALGGWTGTTRVQFAVKPEEGCGLLFLLDSDWRDSDVKTTSSLNLMGDLIEDNFDF